MRESSEPRREQAADDSRRSPLLVQQPFHNVPAPLTGFIGRGQEIAEVTRLLERTRLLTLTGPGGSGKTRLAIEIARRLAESFEDGMWWTDLAPLPDPALVPQTVATALGVRQQPDRSFTETLSDQLRSRRLLLVLDNCEHLVAACAELADTLLHACPELRILATSREALGIAGEIAWLVPPLSLPDPGADVAALMEAEAVQLFVERAMATLPTFRLTEQNGPAVAHVCQRLDGIPLAIELAAARVKVLSPGQIASRLDDCFRLLTIGSRTAVPRQQTLRAAIDWSYDLLAEQERLLFRRLSVFAGGFTLEAAEAVCMGADVAPDEVLDLLTHLVDRSLVGVREHAGDARYRLLETVRQYAAERLNESGEAESVRRRHATHFLALAGAAEPELIGARQGTWMDRLEADHDNLRASLRWFLADEDALSAVRLSGAIWRFWQTRGYLSEGRRWLEEALNTPSPPPAESGERATEWRAARASTLKGAGVLAWGQGDHCRATELFEDALTLVREIGDKDGTASLYNNLGVIAMHQADYARAAELFEASLALRREHGHQWGIAVALNNLGATAGKQGDCARARIYYEESLALQRAMGNIQGIALGLSNLGDVAYREGDYARATALLTESLALRQQLGDKTGVAAVLGKLGAVSLQQGDHVRARALYEESLVLLRGLGDKERIADGLVGAAALALARGDPARAVRLRAAAEAIRDAIGAPPSPDERPDWDRLIAAARDRMNAADFAAAWADGRALSLEQALDLAAEELRSVAAPPRPPEAHQLQTAEVAPSPPAEIKPAPELRILALGPLEVWRGERAVSPAEWGSAKPRELLFYLLYHPGGRTKEQIGLALWPDASPAQLRNSFHVTLHHLRRALGRPEWIVFDNDRYRFDRSLPYEFDVDAFEMHLARAEQLRHAQPPALAEAIRPLEESVRLYRGDFLEETLFGDWHLEWQDELRRRYLDALVSLAELRFAEGHYGEAADAYRRALARDNLRESAHRGLMRSLARHGERERALKHYPILIALLRDELDTEPEAETTALYERVRQGKQV